MVELLLDLPEQQQAVVVTTWLSWGDIARLDTAIGSPTKRFEFWKLIRSMGCSFGSYSRFADSKTPICWIMHKQFMVRSLELGYCTIRDRKKLGEILLHFGKKLHTIVFNYSDEWSYAPGVRVCRRRVWISPESELLRVTMYCPNIQHLTIKSGKYILPTGDFATLPPSLKSLHLEGVAPCANILKVAKTVHLVGLKFTQCFYHPIAFEPELCNHTLRSLECANASLGQFFPKLTHLNIFHENHRRAQVRLIAENCKHLTHITLYESLDTTTAEYAASQWPQLEYLKVNMTEDVARVFKKRCPLLTTLIMEFDADKPDCLYA